MSSTYARSVNLHLRCLRRTSRRRTKHLHHQTTEETEETITRTMTIPCSLRLCCLRQTTPHSRQHLQQKTFTVKETVKFSPSCQSAPVLLAPNKPPLEEAPTSIQQDNRFQNIEHGPSFCSSMIHNVTSPPPAAPNKLPPGHSAHQLLSLTSKLHQTSGTGRTEEATTRTASCKCSLYRAI